MLDDHSKALVSYRMESAREKRAKLYREQADYGDFYVVSAQEAEAQIQSAREFIIEVETAIERLK